MNLAQSEEKRAYNQELFGAVAPAYQRVTRVLSMGRDQGWKKALVNQLPEISAPTCLDLACGTGDLAKLLSMRYPKSRIVGIDQNPKMLAIGQARLTRLANITLVKGDMCRIPLQDSSVDVVTGGYAIRNAPDLDSVLGELHRVLKPEGTAGFLDFSKSPRGLRQRMELKLLRLWGGLWGRTFHRNSEVYAYIASSLDNYPDRERLRILFSRHGLMPVWSRHHFGGLIELVVFQKGKT